MNVRWLIPVLMLGISPPDVCDAVEPVTVENFVRAESDRYFQNYVKKGGLGELIHRRKPTPINDQSVIRMNRDTLYSVGVFDLSSPLSIQKPDADGRFQSLQVISQDHYSILVAYDPGEYIIRREMVGTRYAVVLFRTLVDSASPDDVDTVNEIQDQIAVSQASIGSFEVPDWDQKSLSRLRDAINLLGSTVTVNVGMFGNKDDVNPLYHLIGTAYGWGGNPREEVIYRNVVPAQNVGSIPHTMRLCDPPADGFWSISVYNKQGYFEANEWSAYSINSHTAVRGDNGCMTIHFGGDPAQPNYLHIMDGWNFVLRLFRPRSEAIDGSWKFPQARQVPGKR